MSATGPSGHAQPLSIEMWFDMHQLLRSCHHRLPICKISSPIWLPLVFLISPVLTCKCDIIHPQPMLTSFFCWALYTLTRLWCLGWWWVALLGVGCPTERLLSPRGHDLCMTLRNFAHETPVICCNPNALQSAKIQVSLNCINIHFHGMLIWCWMAKHVKKTNRYFLIYCVPARYTSSRCVAFLWNLKTTSSHQSSTNSCRRSFGSKGPKARGGNKTQYFESLGVGSISRVFIERSHVFVQQEGSQVLLFSPFTFQNGNDD